jgi:hypothetical protein
MSIYIPDTTGINDIDAFYGNLAQECRDLVSIIDEQQRIIKNNRTVDRAERQKLNKAHLQRCINYTTATTEMLKRYNDNENDTGYKREKEKFRRDAGITKSLEIKYRRIGSYLIEKQDPELYTKTMNQIYKIIYPKETECTEIKVVHSVTEENDEKVSRTEMKVVRDTLEETECTEIKVVHSVAEETDYPRIVAERDEQLTLLADNYEKLAEEKDVLETAFITIADYLDDRDIDWQQLLKKRGIVNPLDNH